MEETQAGRIAARLFFLGFFQSQTAVQAAVEALHIWRNRRPAKVKNVLQNDMVLLIEACAKVWRKNKKNLDYGQPIISNPQDWQMPAGIELSHWFEFRKQCESTELMVFILNKILGLPEEVVAQGLGEAVGTIHFRTARAMKQLGAILQVEQRATL